ncbi:hypothetical protein ACS0TY_004252 [Phlomoides rotata]
MTRQDWKVDVDARVLRDALCRENGFKVPHGEMDAGSADQVMAKLQNRNDKGRRSWSV